MGKKTRQSASQTAHRFLNKNQKRIKDFQKNFYDKKKTIGASNSPTVNVVSEAE